MKGNKKKADKWRLAPMQFNQNEIIHQNFPSPLKKRIIEQNKRIFINGNSDCAQMLELYIIREGRIERNAPEIKTASLLINFFIPKIQTGIERTESNVKIKATDEISDVKNDTNPINQ